MLDNVSLIPGEAFEMAGNISINLINKISNATGYILTPRGKRKNKEDAINYFIEEIKKNDKMPLYLKAVNISEARRLLKKYSHQENIIFESMKYLNDNANPDLIDDDWLVNFMEKAGNISNKDVQAIYAKILSEECNKPGTISRNLINIISIMDKELANAFKELMKCVIFIENENGEEEPSAMYPMNDEEYNKSLHFMDIVNLSSLGLIEYSAGLSGGYIWSVKRLKARYGNQHFILKCQDEETGISGGNVSLTRSGMELAKVLTPEVEYTYLEKIKSFWRKREIEVIEE